MFSLILKTEKTPKLQPFMTSSQHFLRDVDGFIWIHLIKSQKIIIINKFLIKLTP